MALPIFSATDHLEISGFTDNGTVASWGSVANVSGNSTVFDENEDGNLDSTGTPDYFSIPTVEYTGYTIEINGNTYAIFQVSGTNTAFIPYDDSFDDLNLQLPIASQTTDKLEDGTAANFCFVAGTGIATTTGETAVEHLQIGELILTGEGRSVAVKWIGRQTVRQVFGLMNDKLEPVRIRAGALANGLPHRDLTVSADHGMIVDGLVINASALVNGTTIDFVPAAELDPEFTYYHVETEHHDCILANGALAETFVDVAGRMAFDNYREYLDLYGVERIIPEMDRPRISSRRLLPARTKERLGIAKDVMEIDISISA